MTSSYEILLVLREMPDETDVNRLIEEVKAHPILWDIHCGEYRDKKALPQQWAEIADTLAVNVDYCKWKWKNLRDAYRAEVRRIERRKELLQGTSYAHKDIRSKWAFFQPMSFISDSHRRRNISNKSEGETEGEPEGEASNGSQNTDEPPGFHSICDIKLEPYQFADEDEFEDDDRLLEEFVKAATPQAVRRLSNSISEANAAEDAAMEVIAPPSSTTAPTTTAATGSNNCKCSKRADDQVHFLETLEREEQSLMQSTRMDMRRDDTLSHVGDSDYNFLVSFLPKMKQMSELQNLQFRAKMSDLLLNIMAPPQMSVVPVQAMNAASISGVQYQQQQQQPPSLLRSSVPAIQQQVPQRLEVFTISDVMESSNDLGEDSSNN